MENTHRFTVEVRIKPCVERCYLDKHDIPSRTVSGAEALDMFAKVLEAYGMEVTKESVYRGNATISIRHPTPLNAESLRNRGGGRRMKDVSYRSPLYMLDDAQTLEWLESHTVAEGMEALGCSRRTYYRRLESLRGKEG